MVRSCKSTHPEKETINLCSEVIKRTARSIDLSHPTVCVCVCKKYECLITGLKFFRQSRRHVGMLRRNAEPGKSKQRWEPANDGGREAGPGRQERGRGGVKGRMKRRFFNHIGMQTCQHPNLSRRLLLRRGAVHIWAGGWKEIDSFYFGVLMIPP